ncbi:MAG: PilZ domain-containing protein [Terracidiphilus sp.]
MDARFLCVYNLAREVFLSSNVTVADCADQPLKMLKVLVSGLALDAESGFWVSPLSAAPPVPRLFPFDLLYLDENQQIVDAVEVHPGVDFPPYHREVASALVLPLQTMQSTQTGRGDRLIIGLEEEIETQIAALNALSTQPIALSSRPSRRRVREAKSPSSREAAFSRLESAVFTAHVSSAAIAVPENIVMMADGLDADAPAPGAALTNGLAVTVDDPWAGAEPAQSDFSLIAAQSPISDAGILPSAEMPVISITEVVLQRSLSQAPVINGQHGGVEDLFSNWVDAPPTASAWMERNGVSQGNGAHTLPPVSRSAPERAKAQEQNVAAGRKTAAQPKDEPEVSAKHKDIAAVPATQRNATAWKPQHPATGDFTPINAPVAISGPTRTPIPQQPIATTFTVAQYGLWRANGINHVAEQGPRAERHANSVANGRSSNTAKIEPDSRQAGMADVPDPGLEDLMAFEALQASAGLVTSPQERVLASAAAKSTPLDDLAKNAIDQPPDSAAGFAEQLRVARAAIVVPDKAKRPRREAPAPDDSERSEEAGEKAAVDSKAVVQGQTDVSKQPDEKNDAASSARGELSLTLPLPGIRKSEEKGKLKISIQRVDANGKAKEQPLSLGTRFRRWLNPVAPVNSDRRKAHRRYVPGMVAHYFTGGAPRPHDVADISMTGFYLLTEDRWMPDTMIQMTLQKPCAKGERKQSITVLSKIVRRGSDGVAAQFVMPESLDPQSHDVQPSQATDRFTLARFL